jgi:hypothetical protein
MNFHRTLGSISFRELDCAQVSQHHAQLDFNWTFEEF